MVINQITLSGTASTGALSVNSPMPVMGLLRQLVIDPDAGNTTYNISVLNKHSIKIYERLSTTGTLAEEVAIPLLGVHTVKIEAATVDTTFTILLMTEE